MHNYVHLNQTDKPKLSYWDIQYQEKNPAFLLLLEREDSLKRKQGKGEAKRG